MKVGQRLAIIEPGAFGHEALDELEHAVGAIDEAAQRLPGVNALLGLAFVEPAFSACGVLGRGQEDEGEEIARLEMRGVFLEVGFALGVDQRGCGLWKAARRVGADAVTLGLDKDRPPGAQAAEGVVEPAGDRDELSRHRGIEIGPAEACCALEAAVLVEDNAFANQRRPR